MCGIAGMIDLSGKRPVQVHSLHAMAAALVHRGPDQDGFLIRPGLGLASRRLSIVGLRDGRQPIGNETNDVSVVFNGELFDYPEQRAELEQRGHHFATHCDTELLPHLWEEYQEAMFHHLRGQFAFGLWDEKGQCLILARDRFGICPLYWTRQGNWLLFASEIKALLASGMVTARADPRGINHVFTFFALPGPVTCFKGVEQLLPGHYLRIRLGLPAVVEDRSYWELDFPDRGQEDLGRMPSLVEELEARLVHAVTRRLRADVPVVSYLSGGVDSGMVAALARHVRGEPIPAFTIRIPGRRFDETGPAARTARQLGVEPTVVECGSAEVLATYPELIQAAEAPVIDTSCAALLRLARQVHDSGYKVALTGEGADEWLAGYPWYRFGRVTELLDLIPFLPLSQAAFRTYLRLTGAPRFPWWYVRRIEQAVGGPNAWLPLYGLITMSKLRFFSRSLWAELGDHLPYDDLRLNRNRLRRWHPLNRSLYLGARVLLPGLLLQAKGDRVAMHSSVETRYPFLDDDVFAFLARLHPRWKLRGLRDKYLLRRLAERWLPRDVAWRPKAVFRAPFDVFHLDRAPAFVNQLLSQESLRRTGYFDLEAVQFWRQSLHQMRAGSGPRASIEMGLAGVVTTQLWHHTFLDGNLADVPSLAKARPAALVAS
jgi:asparagine synthase (glutamine-hydrolysing)